MDEAPHFALRVTKAAAPDVAAASQMDEAPHFALIVTKEHGRFALLCWCVRSSTTVYLFTQLEPYRHITTSRASPTNVLSACLSLIPNSDLA